jgi:hypothetical protein
MVQQRSGIGDVFVVVEDHLRTPANIVAQPIVQDLQYIFSTSSVVDSGIRTPCGD